MPPGRGQKRDAPSTSMPSLPTTIITRPQHQQQQSNSSTADTTPQSSAVILKLSKACKKHLDQHSDPNNPSVRALADGTKLPELCQRDIQTLKKLLPKVEKAIRPPTKKGQTGPSAVDVAHLCDYYQSVIRGVFCPHAAHLFDQGQGGIEGKFIDVSEMRSMMFRIRLADRNSPFTALLPFFLMFNLCTYLSSSPCLHTVSTLVDASDFVGCHFQDDTILFFFSSRNNNDNIFSTCSRYHWSNDWLFAWLYSRRWLSAVYRDRPRESTC